MTGYRRLPLDGLINARDLGGFACRGGVTQFGIFIRSEVPARLSNTDLSFLRDYGVRTVLDFRGGEEIEKAPDMLSSQPWVRYMPIPLFNADAAQGAVKKKDQDKVPGGAPGFTWKDHYIAMAEDGKGWMKSVLEALARAEGAALFHCTTGKDRTGLVTAAILSLCGVRRDEIVADYSVSQTFLLPLYLNMTHLMPPGFKSDLSHPFFSTAPENMDAYLGYIDEKYGSVSGYIRSCGVDEYTIEALCRKLICQN